MCCLSLFWRPTELKAFATTAAGHLGWTDEAQLEFAAQDTRVLITHNRTDFEQLAIQWWNQQKDHSGIVLAIRRANSYDLLRHVLSVLGMYDQGGWRNVVMYA